MDLGGPCMLSVCAYLVSSRIHQVRVTMASWISWGGGVTRWWPLFIHLLLQWVYFSKGRNLATSMGIITGSLNYMYTHQVNLLFLWWTCSKPYLHTALNPIHTMLFPMHTYRKVNLSTRHSEGPAIATRILVVLPYEFCFLRGKTFQHLTSKALHSSLVDMSAQLCIIKELGLVKGVVVLRQSFDNGYLYLLSN